LAVGNRKQTIRNVTLLYALNSGVETKHWPLLSTAIPDVTTRTYVFRVVKGGTLRRDGIPPSTGNHRKYVGFENLTPVNTKC
jgi:hypothetical protein